MFKIDGERLNSLEKQLFRDTQPLILNCPNISITDLSCALGVSSSKISKFVRKLGFASFKTYKNYVSSHNLEMISPSEHLVDGNFGEISRLADYLASFNHQMVVDFWTKIRSCNKLVLYGIGPSHLCAEYFAYRLRIASDIFVIATSDEAVVRHSDNSDTKLVILSTTGLFKSFDEDVKGLNYQEIIFLFEEFRPFPNFNEHAIFYLTQSPGDSSKKPFEKSRTLFFIFLEEVIQCFFKYKSK
ncbi:MurR/RpiR family transcriptional regulator [Thorsellia kenyensis]|uniref:MurR/RpiR family transcriptional regulator n=1 Tax=Thorsellia kenyensis TaxID=1549888 RepID=A0ABV6C8A8_9GAMM